MFAKFSADESIAYVVKDNLKNNIRNRSTSSNIFIEDLEKGTIRKINHLRRKRKLINGTFDWVYMKRSLVVETVLFLMKMELKIAFWQVDASAVKDFYMINTDSIYSFTIPVEYPKVGQDLTVVKIGIINLKKSKKKSIGSQYSVHQISFICQE